MEEILTPDMRQGLRESFSLLRQPVKMVLFSREGTNDQYNRVIHKLLKEMAVIDTRITVEFHTLGDGESKKFGVERSPTLLIAPEKYSIRFTGSPLGEQGRSLIVAIIMASTGKTVLSPESLKRLDRLKEKASQGLCKPYLSVLPAGGHFRHICGYCETRSREHRDH